MKTTRETITVSGEGRVYLSRVFYERLGNPRYIGVDASTLEVWPASDRNEGRLKVSVSGSGNPQARSRALWKDIGSGCHHAILVGEKRAAQVSKTGGALPERRLHSSMGLTDTKSVAAALDDAGVRLLRVTHLRDSYVVLTLEWGKTGNQVQITMRLEELLNGTVPAHPKRRTWNKQPSNVYSQKSEWTEDELRAENLPLYWAEDWLKTTYDDLGSFAAIEREYGYDEATLSYFAGKHYDWQVRPRRDEVRKKVVSEWQSGHHNKKALAAKYGVSIGSVFNWVGGIE